jgi:hypothetical protein
MDDGLRHIRIQAFTRTDRHEMIARLRNALQTGHADLLDFKMFSNTAISITFEVAGEYVKDLRNALVATGISLDSESVAVLNAEDSVGDIVNGSLNVTFIHNDPDLRIPVPPIPD